MNLPEKEIKRLSELLKSTDLAEIEVQVDQMRVRVRAKDALVTQHVSTSVAPTPAPAATASPGSSGGAKPEAGSDLHIIRSPFVGTFYRSPSPNSDPFVKEGDSVSKAKVLCIVEAMKVMNEIEADTGGSLEKVYVEDGSPVDYNAPLFGIRK